MKPTVDDFLNLSWPVDAKITPNGHKVAYTLRITNWKENRYENLCYIYDRDTKITNQLTNTGSVTQINWINNDDLALIKNNFGNEKPQIWLYQGLTGDGIQLTQNPNGVESFEKFGEGIIFLADDPVRKERKKRKERYGNFTRFEQDESASGLFYTSIKEIIKFRELFKKEENSPEPTVDLSRLLPNHPKIYGIYPTTNELIYINCREKDYLVYSKEVSSYKLTVNPDNILEEYLKRGGVEKAYQDISHLGEVTKIPLPRVSYISSVSSDGSKIIITHKEPEEKSYIQADLWLLDVSGSDDWNHGKTCNLKKLTNNLDRVVSNIKWSEKGLYVSYSDHTKTKISRLSETGELETLDLGKFFPISSFDISKVGSLLFLGTNSSNFPELCIKNLLNNSQPVVITNFGNQIKDWDLGQVETISWMSRDGSIIEGVIRKPQNFNPHKKYPLAFIIHGGPQTASLEVLLEIRDCTHYPGAIFAEKEVITVKPNYRGSTGRGKDFLALNKENLGIGDLWDVESCIDFLVAEGYIDDSKVGCMGWSQGGYISAMASTSSNRFKAVSVGAGISDWYTYHISTDIPYFTEDYLGSDPFNNRELYYKTSPMTRIKEAKTPTLIQHGEKDNRVPFSNATELYRGLKALNIPVELITFPEMTHSIDKPKENRAIAEQNLAWFTHYLLGKKLELPN
jgi:dipeptidyl aminopeptidase/acylaminoacyl peptidase